MTQLLFDEKLAPITREVGFLQAPCDRCVQEFLEWQRPLAINVDRGFQTREVSGELPGLLLELLLLTRISALRWLFVPTAGPWTALFSNRIPSPDLSGPLHVLAEYMDIRTVKARGVTDDDRPDSSLGRYGACSLEVTDGPENRRTIYAMNDGGRWEFADWGEPFDFERPEAYQRRRVRDRFDFELLAEYLENLGIRAFDESFYAPDRVATLVEKTGVPAEHFEEATLEEERRHQGYTDPAS